MDKSSFSFGFLSAVETASFKVIIRLTSKYSLFQQMSVLVLCSWGKRSKELCAHCYYLCSSAVVPNPAMTLSRNYYWKKIAPDTWSLRCEMCSARLPPGTQAVPCTQSLCGVWGKASLQSVAAGLPFPFLFSLSGFGCGRRQVRTVSEWDVQSQ